MNFYRWTPQPEDEGNACIAKILVPGLFVDSSLNVRTVYDPAPFAEWEWHPEAAAYWNEEYGPLTDLPFSDEHFALHSPRLKALMERLGLSAEIQYLPMQVRSLQSGALVGEYYFAHFLRRVRCFDWEQGDWGESPLVFRYEAMAPWRLFRIWEWPHCLAVREDVKRAIEEAGITGCCFDPIETTQG